MKLTFIKRIAICLGVALPTCFAIASDSGSGVSTRTAAPDVQWLDSGFGPKVSPVFGDFSKSAHVTFVRFKAGMVTDLHTHSADYVGIVLSGVTMHWEPGKPETKKQLGAGAHWFIPGDLPHVSECLPGAECLMALYQRASMDFLPVK